VEADSPVISSTAHWDASITELADARKLRTAQIRSASVWSWSSKKGCAFDKNLLEPIFSVTVRLDLSLQALTQVLVGDVRATIMTSCHSA
jgi:hypothetical protein